MGERAKAAWVWGGGGGLPPSVERIHPLPWLAASAGVGAACGALALSLLWRPLPMLDLPPGDLQGHAARWLAVLANAISPALFGETARDYAVRFGALPSGEKLGLGVRLALAAVAALAPFALLARPMLSACDALIHTRGPRRLSGEQARRRLRAALKERVAAGPDHEIAPGIPYPAELWTQGTLIVGGVGSGKSTVLRPLIDKVVRSRERMLLFDAKSEFTAGWREPALLAPWDARSLAWDIAKDACDELEMERFAEAMVLESKDPMWSGAARQILVGAMLALRGTRGDAWGWADLRDMLLLPREAMLDAMRAWHPVAEAAVAGPQATSGGITITLRACCAPIFQLAKAWGAHAPERRVSIREWALGRSRHRQLILQGYGAGSPLARSCAQGIVGAFCSLVTSIGITDSKARKLWLIADEVAQLGAVPILDLFALGRSRGVRCVIAAQDLSQLSRVHDAEAVKSLVSMVGTVLVGRTMQGESAEALCKALGSREVERPSGEGAAAGPQRGASFARDQIALYTPSELGSRLGLSKDRKSVRLILFTDGAPFELSWPLFEMRERRKAHEPAAWLWPSRASTGFQVKTAAPAAADGFAADSAAPGRRPGGGVLVETRRPSGAVSSGAAGASELPRPRRSADPAAIGGRRFGALARRLLGACRAISRGLRPGGATTGRPARKARAQRSRGDPDGGRDLG